MNINYSDIFVTLATQKVETVVNFYTKLFGIEPIVYRPQIYAEFQLEKLRIAIFKPKSERQSEFDRRGGSAFSLCLEVENLERAIACLTDLGYPPPGEIITASHGKEIYSYDPIGNRLILHQSS